MSLVAWQTPFGVQCSKPQRERVAHLVGSDGRDGTDGRTDGDRKLILFFLVRPIRSIRPTGPIKLALRARRKVWSTGPLRESVR